MLCLEDSPVLKVPMRVMKRCMSLSMASPFRSHSTRGHNRTNTAKYTGTNIRMRKNHPLMISGNSHHITMMVNRPRKKIGSTLVIRNARKVMSCSR